MPMKTYMQWIGIVVGVTLALGCASQKPAPTPAAEAAKPEAKPEAPAPKAEPAQAKAEPAPATSESAEPKKQDPIGDVINGTGKAIGDAGKVIIDGGGKVIGGAGEVIGGAGVAIGKAVGDVIETAFAPGTKAPDFNLHDLDGHPVALADFKGSPVVLAFCTTSYPPCVVEMRHLRDLQAKYESDGLKVVAIALDWEGPAALRRFQQEMAFNYPLLWDNGEVFKAYTQMPNVPTTFFIDKNGHIIKKRVGFASATIITQGASIVGTSMVELDPGFEKDLLELLKK